MNDKRLFAPSTARNRAPILDVLRNVLPAKGVALEIASGAGEHVTFFARRLDYPHGTCQCGCAACAEGRANSLADPRGGRHHLHKHDAHFPWCATEALFESGVRTLSAGTPLYLYGPYRRGGAQTAPSTAAFDASLRARNAACGVRGSGSGRRGCARDKEVLGSCNRRSILAAARKQRERTTIPMEPNSSIGITRQCQ